MIILKDWIPAQSTPPNRCALWRGPRKAGMTQNIAWWTCFGGTFPPFHLQRSCHPRSISFHHPTTTSRHHEVLSGYRPPLPPLVLGVSSLGMRLRS